MDTLKADTDFLKTVPIFKNLSDGDLAVLTDHFKVQKYGRDQQICEEGEISGELFIVRDGFVNIARGRKGEDKTFVATIGKGDYFGEASLLGQQKRIASASASSHKLVLYILDSSRFLKLIESNPAIGNSVFLAMLGEVFLRLGRVLGELEMKRKDGMNQNEIDDLLVKFSMG